MARTVLCPACHEQLRALYGDPRAGERRVGLPSALCAEHALAVLEDVRRHLATTLTALERATHRAAYVVASGPGG